MKTRYEIIGTATPYILGSIVLYGDQDEKTDRMVMEMIREALSVNAIRAGRQEVLVRCERLDI